jgi:proline iminopeptidase
VLDRGPPVLRPGPLPDHPLRPARLRPQHAAREPGAYSDRPPAALLAFVRICTHYFAHRAWLDDGVLLRDAGRLAGIPGVLVHGRLDLGGPLEAAWSLARAWPGSVLHVVDDAGHTGSAAMRRLVHDTLDRFARR